MEKISEIIKNRAEKKEKVNSERSAVIKEFVDELNKDRGGRLLVSPKVVAMKLSHLKLPDLYCLLSICRQSKCFGKKFWWAIRTQK